MLVAVIGDVHGRFFRVEEWVEELERNLGEEVAVVLAVGDIETFSTPDDHRRKSTKRNMPAEFAAYARGERQMRREFVFVGGNNEDFEELERYPEGGELVPRVRYLGRAGSRMVEGLNLAYLSGIYAPTRFDRPRLPATNAESSKQAGYFRQMDVDQVRDVRCADLLMLHEWPRGIAGRESAVAKAGARGIRQRHWPQVGNPHAAALVSVLRPRWVLCGHLHVPHAATFRWDDGRVTRVVCLDQASRADGGLLWMRWDGNIVRQVGWGTSGEVSWKLGMPWDERQTASRIRIEPREAHSEMGVATATGNDAQRASTETVVDDDDAPPETITAEPESGDLGV
jgi:lariat debranching enzyme